MTKSPEAQANDGFGKNFKILACNDQIKELQTIIRDR
jgi:hypothetical protein